MAKTLFNSGSKQMAHNLDDLYDRWQLRREAATEENWSTEIGIEEFVPDIPNDLTITAALGLKPMLDEKRRYIDAALVDHKAQRNKMNRTVFEEKRLALSAAANRLNYQQRQVNGIIGQPVNSMGVIHDLKKLEKAGTITVQEQILMAMYRYEAMMNSISGTEKGIEKAIDEEDRVGRMSDAISNMKRDIINLQRNLLKAYERIIELQGEK